MQTMVLKKEEFLHKRYLIPIALVGCVLLSGYGYYWFTHQYFIQTTDDAYVGGDITTLKASVAGYITAVNVRDNEAVKAGAELLQIDDRDYQAAYAKAHSAVDVQQATLKNLAATRSLKEAMVGQASAAIAGNDAQIERTRDDLSRYQKLYKTNVVSMQSLQKAQSDFIQAMADGQQARASLLAAQRELAVVDTQREQTLATLEQSRADQDLALLNLEHTHIRAPVDGFTGNRQVRKGSWVDAGSQLLDIVPARGLWVEANFKEDQLDYIKPGQRATIRADIHPERVLHGTVDSLAPGTGSQFSLLPTENATGNFTKIVQRVPVRITLDERDSRLGFLRPGLSVTVAIDTHDLERP